MSLLKNELKKNMSYPIELYDSNGNKIYCENSGGYWCKYEYDSNGNIVYFESLNGHIEDNRPKVKEMTVTEISQQLGYEVKVVK